MTDNYLTRSARQVDRASLDDVMAAAGMDVIVAMSPRNIWYLTGHPRLNGTQRPGATTPALAVVARNHPPTLVVSRWHTALARGAAATDTIKSYRNYVESPFTAVADVLEERGLADAVVGLETDFVVDGDFRVLAGVLPEATIVDLGGILDGVRIRRSSEQLAASEDAYRRLAQAVQRGLATAYPGESRLAVHTRIMREVLDSGSDSVRGGISGLDEVIVPLVSTSNVPLADGDLLGVEYTCAYGLYAARLRRTVVVGAADTSGYQRLYAAVRGALGAFGPAVSAGAVAVGVAAAVVDAGDTLVHPVIGHGITLGYEEAPLVVAGSTDVLAPGVEFVIEPRVASGLRIGIHAVMTADGLVFSEAGSVGARPDEVGGSPSR